MIPSLCGGFFAPTSAAALPTQSIDFESSSSQYLSMTDANFGAFDRAKFAISLWIKRESTGAAMALMSQSQTTGNRSFNLRLLSSDKLDFLTYVDGSAVDGRITTTATYTSTANWYQILVWFDSANVTPGDRMRMWVDGVEVTAFDTDTNPTAAVFNSTQGVTVSRENTGNFFDGLMYQVAFFSGTLPTIGQVYNAGAPVDVSTLTGLWSYLNVGGGSVTTDPARGVAWTNNGTATPSNTIP